MNGCAKCPIGKATTQMIEAAPMNPGARALGIEPAAKLAAIFRGQQRAARTTPRNYNAHDVRQRHEPRPSKDQSMPSQTPGQSSTPLGASAAPLAGRVAVVTGASAGIGEAIARDLASAGARVVINARRAERLEALAREINAGAHGGSPRCVSVAGDAAEQAVIDQMLNTAKRAFGAEADLVVVNAGRGLNGSVLTSEVAQWDEMVRTNILACAALMRAAGKRMMTRFTPEQCGLGGPWLQSPCDLVVIGSVVGRHVSPFSSMYGGTKFAVHGMVEGVRRELGPRGVRVTLIAPGFVVSEFQQVAGYEQAWFQGVKERIGPPLDPADVARAVAFVAQQPAHVHVSEVMVRPTRQEYP